MRITNNMLISNNLWNINNNMKRYDEASQRLSTQRKIGLASDDPQVATQAVKYRNYVSTIDQYEKNVSAASSWMSVTEGALSDLQDVVQQVRDYVEQGANGSNTSSDLSNIKADVQQLKETAIQTLNTSYAGRYVFGGYSTDTAPYAETTLTTGSSGSTTSVDKVTFKGKIVNLDGPVSTSTDSTDYTTIYNNNISNVYTSGSTKESMKYNSGFGTQITVNVEGQDVVGQGSDNLFNTLDKVLLGLGGDTSYQTVTTDSSGNATGTTTTSFTLSGLLGDLDECLDRISIATTGLGARESSAELASDRLSNDNTTYNKLMSNNEDVDSAEATTEYSSAKTVYETSLSAAAKAITKSLLDYI
ncbi:MAG TPA: flagellar hook-associated protein FlgL [Syntrophomonadaceae bacterium]|nr:flagellar hook-associated protein FlgL [Syntrophomonadaceae bacterium]